MKQKVIRILLYITIPVLFALIGYGLMYTAAAPGVKMLLSNITTAKSSSNHESELKTIYHPEADIGQKQPQIIKEAVVMDTPLAIEAEGTSQADLSVDIKGLQFPKLGEHYAMLVCDRIQLEVPVYWGDTSKILDAGAGQYMGSFLPGFGRYILLSAHNTTYFKCLEQIKVGDIIMYDTNYGDYQYVVDEITIMRVADAEVMLKDLLGERQEKLVLYTCYPFHSFAGSKEERFFVFANKQSGPRVEIGGK
jgi:sortase A